MILCSASKGIPCIVAMEAHSSPNMERAMVRPPEAEPVMPPIILVVTTAETRGPAVSPIPTRISFMGRKPGMLTKTLPKAKPEATFSTAAQEEAADETAAE